MLRYAKEILLMVLFIMLSNIAMSQSYSEVVSSIEQGKYQLFENGESVPRGNSVRLMSSFVPLGEYPNYLSGRINFDYNGLISVGFIYDNSFGNPLGRMILSNQLELRFQILEERAYLPAVSILYQRSIGKQDVFYNGRSIWSDNRSIYKNSLAPRLYNEDNALIGIGISSKVSEKLHVSWLFGQREFVIKQENNSQTSLPPQTSFRLHWSSNGSYKLSDDLSVIASVQNIPLLENDLASFTIVPKVGYRSTFGFRYYLAQSINMDVYDQMISGYSNLNSYHYIRLGITTGFSFN